MMTHTENNPAADIMDQFDCSEWEEPTVIDPVSRSLTLRRAMAELAERQAAWEAARDAEPSLEWEE